MGSKSLPSPGFCSYIYLLKFEPMKLLFSVLFLMLSLKFSLAQNKAEILTVEKIMRDPKWIGSSPSQLQWNASSDTLFFMWNSVQAAADSLYYITVTNKSPKPYKLNKFNKSYGAERKYSRDRTAFLETIDGDIYYSKGNKRKKITATIARESNPQFSFNESRVVYNLGDNLYSWDIETGIVEQLTNFLSKADEEAGSGAGSAEEEAFKKEQLQLITVLQQRKDKAESRAKLNQSLTTTPIAPVYTAGKTVVGAAVDQSGQFVAYRLLSPASRTKSTIVPNYVTESGFTENIPTRAKVGTAASSLQAFIYDRKEDTVYSMSLKDLPGMNDKPEFLKDYDSTKGQRKKILTVSAPVWSPAGSNAFVEIRSTDNKDRWLAIWKAETKKLELVDHQHNEAWIGGPGINANAIGWINADEVFFRSERTGYSHLYTHNLNTKKMKALTEGNYEVQDAILSLNKKSFYISTNAVHPGEQHFYKLDITSTKQIKLTSMEGANNSSLSPDEKYIALLHSYTNKPWELYLQPNKENALTEKITNKAASAEWSAYPWRDPEVMSFKAADGADVYARVYKPVNPKPGAPAVLFVHGAGYLQNAHKWWSSYFREYMFNNMLADNGYYVMDIDYRASAGYGEKWRTGIYRHMGGKDLSDHVDAAKYMVENFGVDAKKIGLYGGSYGGFITLMGMFNQPEIFAAGAALRPVTDWANYNHGYTSNILNEPFTDSMAYRKSSPIYFAEGLKGNLLICHGMLDVNVHYQDVVKLTQRLIELGKTNWELASYPLEDHGFVEPSSWTDEYLRIFKLFETTLKK